MTGKKVCRPFTIFVGFYVRISRWNDSFNMSQKVLRYCSVKCYIFHDWARSIFLLNNSNHRLLCAISSAEIKYLWKKLSTRRSNFQVLNPPDYAAFKQFEDPMKKYNRNKRKWFRFIFNKYTILSHFFYLKTYNFVASLRSIDVKWFWVKQLCFPSGKWLRWTESPSFQCNMLCYVTLTHSTSSKEKWNLWLIFYIFIDFSPLSMVDWVYDFILIIASVQWIPTILLLRDCILIWLEAIEEN